VIEVRAKEQILKSQPDWFLISSAEYQSYCKLLTNPLLFLIMIIKAAPSHRFIACQQGKKLLCTYLEEVPLEIEDSGNSQESDRSEFDGIMSTDKIKHFYVTVSVTLTSVLLLLIIYGCCTYRK
jgi:hypothetical protein